MFPVFVAMGSLMILVSWVLWNLSFKLLHADVGCGQISGHVPACMPAWSWARDSRSSCRLLTLFSRLLHV